jgi:hypothetical protein
VTPDVCGSCYYRKTGESVRSDAAPQRERIADCAELGSPCLAANGADGEPRFHCRLPQYGTTTRAGCRTCPDYLFPLLTPRMSIDDVKRHRRRGPITQASPQPEGWWTWPNVQQAERDLADERIADAPPYLGHDRETGIVIVGGGKYLAAAYVTARVLRHLGVRLPVQLWHLDGEVDGAEGLLRECGVECVDADAMRTQQPFRFLDGHWWRGWQLKAYALYHAPFREVLLLDADCYPVRDPTDLFEAPEYSRRGAVFWPDIENSLCLLTPEQAAVFGVPPFEDMPAESGQILLDRRRCWAETALAAHYNAQADFTYSVVWGDKDTFPLAWKRLGRPYGRLWPQSRAIPEGILQFDGRGRTLFLHRCRAKIVVDEVRFDSTPGQRKRDWNLKLPLEKVCRSAAGDFAAARRRSLPSRD